METLPILTTCLLPFRISLLALAIPLVFAGCAVTEKEAEAVNPRASLRDIDDATWQTLAQRKIFFGHQSVGANLIDGIRDLQRQNPQIKLAIINSKKPSTVSGPAFVESLVGKNGDPQSKTVAFLAAMDQNLDAQNAVVMFKFCFADMNSATDVQKLFDQYKAAINFVHAKHPSLTVVHITMPLAVSEGQAKALTKKILGKPLERDLAIKRNQFNRLLRQQYDGKEPVFDLAAVESTRLDGRRVFFEHDSAPVYALAPEFTDDGAHLNKLGRRVVAEQFLIALARISQTGS